MSEDFPEEVPDPTPCIAGCGQVVSEMMPVCDECNIKYGEHLSKAMCDPFDFAIGLKTGPVLRFIGKTVDVKGEWIALPEPDKVIGLPFPFCRGMQVKFTDIAWVADAPEGS